MARVAIIGAGSIGLCLLHVLKSHGVSDITVVDPLPGAAGARHVVGPDHVAAALSGAYEAVFDAAHAPDARSCRGQRRTAAPSH